MIYAYLIGAAVVAARLGWHMAFRLDAFDWHYAKSDIWTSLILYTLLWPLLLLDPALLFNPTSLFEGPYGFAAAQRRAAQLWINPPPCGSRVRYRRSPGFYEESYGEFIFRAADIEATLQARLRADPHLSGEHEGAILNWLRRRDDTILEPTDVPTAWWRFVFVADELVRQGVAEVKCLRCNESVPNDLLILKDDEGQAGWNFNRVLCPRGHSLLVVEMMHLLTCHDSLGERKAKH
jgi:hypothetical protein